MAETLSEKLGLLDANAAGGMFAEGVRFSTDITEQATDRLAEGVAGLLEADRRATVKAVERWLSTGECLSPAARRIRERLLAEEG